MQNTLQLKLTLIDTLIDTIHKNKKREDYDRLEYELYIFASQVYDFENNYNVYKMDLEEKQTKKYIELSAGETKLSEAAKERQSEIAYLDDNIKKGKSKADVDKYKNYLFSFSRMADHFKSCFIKEMADAKRQDMVEKMG